MEVKADLACQGKNIGWGFWTAGCREKHFIARVA